jgi:hypothetical protein
MKKNFIALVVLVLFCFASVVLAAVSPFSDVPTTNWAYGALNKLAKDGIIEGYGDNTFRGNRTMTRYEMASIVANALTKADKATTENKALINKLATEFAAELKDLGVRMTAVEQNQSPLKITGFFASRYEWVQHPKASPFATPLTDPARNGVSDSSNTTSNALWLFVDNKFDGNTYFHGLINTETVSGRSTDATLNMLEGFVATKVGGTEVAVGRFFPSIGMGFFGSPWMDGVRVSFGDAVKFRLFSTKLLTDPITYADTTYNMADAHFALNKDTTMSLAYVGNGHTNDSNASYGFGNNYRDLAAGLEFKGIPNFNLKGEYAKNSSDYARSQNNGNDAKAYYTTLKYKGANPFVAGSFGLRVEYKYADPGFDSLSYAAPFDWNAPLNWTQPPQGGYNENIKGFEYGFDYTVAPRLLADVRYDVLKTANGKIDGFTQQNFLSAQLTYFF